MGPNLPLPVRERAERANQCDSRPRRRRGSRRRRRPLRRLLAVLVVGLLGGGVAAVVVRKDAPETTITHTQPTGPPITETVVVPAAGQTLVTGTLQSFSADGAVVDLIHTPFTINAVERGAVRHATVEAALINGQRKTIYWDAGQPLPVSGGAGLDLGPSHV